MEKIRIGVICPSEIAHRRFMPAILECENAEYIGVASADASEWSENEDTIDSRIIENERKKAQSFKESYGGKVFESYEALINCNEIDAVYLPLPPALHFKWAKRALEAGKHIFLEKPSTTCASDTKELIALAKDKGLAVHENYMFAFHSQLDDIDEIIKSGKLGDVRLYRIAFGFPRRENNDFRYNKALGGGALLDCGGYTIKLACKLLGDSARVEYSHLNYIDDFEVDIYGSAALVNDDGVTAQVSFGMENSYKCDLEVWGSCASLLTGRILTAPSGFIPTAVIKSNDGEEVITLSCDDTFKKSIKHFCSCIADENIRRKNYQDIVKQAELVDVIKGE